MTDASFEVLFKDAMGPLSKEANLDVDTIDRLAKRLASDAVSAHEEGKHLFVIRAKDGQAVSAIHFSSTAAAGVLASFTGGVLAPASPIALGLVVVGAFFSLLGSATRATYAEAMLFWALRSTSRPASRVALQEAFGRLCEEDTRVVPSEFDSALHGLTKMGCVSELREGYDIAEVVLVVGRTE